MYEQNTSMVAANEQNKFLLPAMVEGDFSRDEIAEDADGLQMMSFQRVKIPAGGALQFEVPTEDPDNPDYIASTEALALDGSGAPRHTSSQHPTFPPRIAEAFLTAGGCSARIAQGTADPNRSYNIGKTALGRSSVCIVPERSSASAYRFP